MIKTIATTLALIWTVQSQATTITKQYLTSAKVDFAKDAATLPLHLGHLKDGRNVYFVLTDTNDAAQATKLGLVHAVQLSAALNSKSTRMATIDAKGNFTFESGAVDFSPKHEVVPGASPNFFPPQKFVPGSVGDSNYSPLVRIEGTDTVYNAPIVAFDVDPSQINFCNGHVNYDLVHDRVTAICPKTMQVSLSLGHGFASGSEVIYLSLDSNNPLPASMENVTYTPATVDLNTSGATQVLYAFANGPVGAMNPERQGFNSALAGEGSPLNILGELSMGNSGYTPLWDVNVAVWTNAAVSSGARTQVTSGADADKYAQMGLLTNPMGAPVSSLGLIVNCPVVAFIK